MKVSSLAKDMEPYLIKLIRNIVGDMAFAGVAGDGYTYRIRLLDQSARTVKEYEVYALGSGDYADIRAVAVDAGAGDVITIPPGGFQDMGDTADGSTSAIAFVGVSRIKTIQEGVAYFAAGGGSIENQSFIKSYNSAADIRGVLLYGAGTLIVDSVHVEITQAGVGDVNGVSSEHGSAIIHVWNSYIKANASGAGAGYAAYATGEVHFHNCHLVYNDAVANPGGAGTVYLHGCSTETI